MNTIKFPLNLPKSRELNYIETIKKGYDKYLKLIYYLGGLCTYSQFADIVYKFNPDLSQKYIEIKSRKIIQNMIRLKLIQSENLNKYKFFYLKRFALSIITNDYNNCSLLNISKSLKTNNFKTHLMIVENYIKNNNIISLNNGDMQLLFITKQLYQQKKLFSELDFDTELLEKIIQDGGIKNCKASVENLPNNNLIKILWIDIKSIFDNLKLQKQPIAKKPYYLKLYYKNNKMTLHYVPEIIIFDTHDFKYYSKKITSLFYKFYNINSNEVRDMKKSFTENNSLGYKGFNHIGYVLTIIGYNKNELLQKQKYINSYIQENPNNIMLTDINIQYIDISKYFNNSSQNDTIFNEIDNKFDLLLEEKIKNI